MGFATYRHSFPTCGKPSYPALYPDPLEQENYLPIRSEIIMCFEVGIYWKDFDYQFPIYVNWHVTSVRCCWAYVAFPPKWTLIVWSASLIYEAMMMIWLIWEYKAEKKKKTQIILWKRLWLRWLRASVGSRHCWGNAAKKRREWRREPGVVVVEVVVAAAAAAAAVVLAAAAAAVVVVVMVEEA